MKVLLTGGLGYIGSHTAVEMMNAGYDIVIADNLSNSKIEVVDKVEALGKKNVSFYKIDVCDAGALEELFEKEKNIGAVIHFAGFKAVGESISEPLKYYTNNLDSTLSLLKAMEKFGVKNLVFSSSATVYSEDNEMPLREDAKLGATNPYGRTKLFIEQILKDYAFAHPDFNVTLLRYFNPIGAHESGLLGEDPNGIPSNLMPYICKVAVGELDHLNIFGNDYDTPDGTGIRDYIHVVDLARGHVLAVKKMLESPSGLNVYNLGTGAGYSVLDIVSTFNLVNGNLVKFEFAERRPGDIAKCYASPEKAKKELGFVATNSLEDMCRSSYNYQKKNRK